MRTSVRGLVSATLTPVILLGLGLAAIARADAVRLVPAGLLCLGALLGAIVLMDYPRRTSFDAQGIERVCPLRRERVPWSQVVAIDRAPHGRTQARSRALDRIRRGDAPMPSTRSGLVAQGRGRTRWLLTDRPEATDEHERLRALVQQQAPDVELRAAPPVEHVRPGRGHRRPSSSS